QALHIVGDRLHGQPPSPALPPPQAAEEEQGQEDNHAADREGSFHGDESFEEVTRRLVEPPRNQGHSHGGDVGRISSYSERSSALPSFAGTMRRSSSISTLVKVLRNLVTNCPSLRWPASSFSAFRSSAGASRTR